jgi:hypothetical protein
MQGNIFADLGYSVFASAGGSGIYEDAADSNMHVSYNLMHGNAGATPTAGWASWSDNIVGDSSAEDPLFGNAGSLDFTLQSNSPARKAMPAEPSAFQDFEDLYGLDIRRDYLGTVRPSNDRSIGATE